MTPSNELTIRRAQDRGHANYGWLNTAHTFSFGSYVDPAHMGFSVLRVINDDRVTPEAGFPRHPHRDMEIVSYVVEGALGHRDTLGNSSVIHPGEVQRMSAGTGISHSEMNAAPGEQTRFLQIWFLPRERGTTPGYEQRMFDYDPARPVELLLSPDGEDGSVSIGQDVRMFRVRFDDAGRAVHTLPEGRVAWLQIVKGELSIEGEAVAEGDGVAISPADPGTPRALHIEGQPGAEGLLMDLPRVA